LKSIPRKISGIGKVEILIIDDGSTDATVKVAKENGADHIVCLRRHEGLAKAFSRGLEESLKLGADIIVNTDADNQYKGEDIPRLIAPILENRADIVIGCRRISNIKDFTLAKKILQKIGSFMVRKFSATDIPDTISGFRAFSREAALRINIFSRYTYTIENIIQAGRKGIPTTYIFVDTNRKLRESRLIKSVPVYIFRSAFTMLRMYLLYEPMKFFLKIGAVLMGTGGVLGCRYLYFFFFGTRRGGHIQSLILAAILIIMGVQTIIIGLLAEVIGVNRQLGEEILYRQKKESYSINK